MQKSLEKKKKATGKTAAKIEKVSSKRPSFKSKNSYCEATAIDNSMNNLPSTSIDVNFTKILKIQRAPLGKIDVNCNHNNNKKKSHVNRGITDRFNNETLN